MILEPKQRFREIAGAVRHTHGWKRGAPDPTAPRMSDAAASAIALPGKFSIRDKWVPIKNQLNEGSCTAHGYTEAMEYLRQKQGGGYVRLAPQFLYNRSRMFEGTPLSEDSGCVIADVGKVVEAIGVCEEALWPYNVANVSVTPPTALETNAALHKVELGFAVPSLVTIKAAIFAGGTGCPVVIGFSCPKAMFSDQVEATGVVPLPDATGFDGGHCIDLVGWDDAAEMFDFANSWSELWGNGGFGRLPYRYVLEGWASDGQAPRRVELG